MLLQKIRQSVPVGDRLPSVTPRLGSLGQEALLLKLCAFSQAVDLQIPTSFRPIAAFDLSLKLHNTSQMLTDQADKEH